MELLKLIAAVFLVFIFSRCADLSEYDNQRIQEALGDSLITSSASTNISMDIIEDGALKMNLKSSRALSITEQRVKTTYLSGPVKIEIFENDSLDTQVQADSAVYLPKEAQFELFGNVEVLSKNGKSLYSDYLKWLRETDEVSTPGRVLIITQVDSIAANGFVGNTDLTNYTLTEVTEKLNSIEEFIPIPAFLGIVSLINPSALIAQTTVEIESVKTLKSVTLDGEPIRKLYEARLRTGGFTIVCDSAWQFLEKDEFRAFGNIQIDTPTEMIWADSLTYFNVLDFSQLRGRVIIKQDSTLLFGNKVNYNFATKVGRFLDDVRLEDDEGILTALSGIYFQNQDSAEFRGDVQLADSAQYVEGDSLFINRKSKFLRLFDNLLVIDSTNNALLTGDYLEADSTGRRYLKGNGYLRRTVEDSTKSDTTHIFADEIELNEQDSTTTIDAYTDVNVWTEKFSSLSDTLLYNSETELFRLRGNPKAWNKNIQLTGPFIFVQLDSSEVQNLTSYPEPFAVQEDTVSGRLNQIKGDTLIADFENGDISKITIYPNSEVLYHITNESNEPDGAFESTSPRTVLIFENGDMVEAKMGQNQGLFLPEYTELASRRLAGFVWTPELRPEKPIINPQPTLPSIPIERPFELPRRFVEHLESLEEDEQ